MSSPRKFSFLGAAKRVQDAAVEEAAEPTTTATNSESDLQKYKWYKCEVEPGHPEYGNQKYYYTNTDTNESSWEEPEEPYWIFNKTTFEADRVQGLQQPTKHEPAAAPKDPLEGYTGYNPKIHGNYDPKADYAQYHNNLRAVENGTDSSSVQQQQQPSYSAAMILNARTGHAQANRPGAEHHNDAAKSGRQLNAFFDADAAANAHQGISLKEERQKQTLSKKQVAEFKKKKLESKRKKKMEWLRS